MAELEQGTPIGMIATRLHRASESDFFARLGKAGYTDLRMRHSVLLEALPQEGARVTTLAAQLGMSKQSMGELVDDLEARGYIQRVNDPADRRARLVSFTRKGRLAFEQALVIIVEMEREYAALVGADRYAEARATFADLVHALEG